MIRQRPSLFKDPITYHAIALGTFMAAASAPTPLYRVYQDVFGVSPGIIAIVFAVYSFALLKALLITGSISDHLGRRPVIFGALLLQIGSMVLFLEATGPGWLIAARIIQGIATGIATTSIGAALVDVDRVRGQAVNSIILPIGMAVGALGTSALIQFGPEPLRLTFGLLLVLFALEALAIWLTPETSHGKPGLVQSLRPRVAVPKEARRAFASMMPLHLANWTLVGFYLSLVPSLVVATTGNRAPLTGGSVVAALMLASAATSYTRRSKDPKTNLAASICAAGIGVATVILGVHLASIAWLLIGTLFCGMGFGLNFLGCLGSVMPLAKADERAELLATFFTFGYLAFSLPAILAGFLASWLGYATTADIYAVAVLALNCAGTLGLLARKRRLTSTAAAPAPSLHSPS